MKSREELAYYEGKDKIITNLELLETLADQSEEFKVWGGFPMMDSYLDGYVPGELIILTGAVKSGKSLFMKSLINNMYKINCERPLVFSYEEMPKYFFEGFANKSSDVVFHMPKEMHAYDIDWVLEKIVESKVKNGTRVVYIDHGHFLFELSIQRNPSLYIGSIARKIKRLAIDEELVIFLIWHIIKGKVESEDDMDYQLLRDSGMLSAEADVVVFIRRKYKSDGIVQVDEGMLKICFSRRTGALEKLIPIEKRNHYFYELEI